MWLFLSARAKGKQPASNKKPQTQLASFPVCKVAASKLQTFFLMCESDQWCDKIQISGAQLQPLCQY